MTRKGWTWVAAMLGTFVLVGGVVIALADDGVKVFKSSACTMIGCSSEISAAFPPHAGEPDARQIRLCVFGRCQTEPIPAKRAAWVAVSITAAEGQEQDIPVDVSLLGDDGAVVHEQTLTMTPIRSAPNGEDCGPICYSGGIGWDLNLGRFVEGFDDERPFGRAPRPTIAELIELQEAVERNLRRRGVEYEVYRTPPPRVLAVTVSSSAQRIQRDLRSRLGRFIKVSEGKLDQGASE